MEPIPVTDIAGAAFVLLAAASAIGKLVVDRRAEREKQADLELAEDELRTQLRAPSLPQAEANLAGLRGGRVEGVRDELVAAAQRRARASEELLALSRVYSRQIEKYQVQTRSRATWSFIAAILAMFAGLIAVFWGGTTLVTAREWKQLASGAALSGIGGTISAFITATFLSVHRLSLRQLNRYFRQPVFNDQVVTAQRLADQLPEDKRSVCYEALITAVIDVIRRPPDGDDDAEPVVRLARAPRARADGQQESRETAS